MVMLFVQQATQISFITDENYKKQRLKNGDNYGKGICIFNGGF